MSSDCSSQLGLTEPALRVGTVADAAGISALVIRLAHQFILPDFSRAGQEWMLRASGVKAVRGYFDDGFRFHVATIASDIVGVVSTRENQHLFHLFVDIAWQGRGVGQQLWHIARQACRDDGYDGPISVNSSRHAVGFYERLRFQSRGYEDYRNEVISVPMVFAETFQSSKSGQAATDSPD